MYEVYMIVNRQNDMKYVGVTSAGYETRFKKHISSALCGSTAPIHCAIREYGIENFELRLLESDVPKSQAGEREQYYIKLYNTQYQAGKGYNMTGGGGGNLAYVYTDEVRIKMSEFNRHRVYTEERNEKIRKAMLGRDYKAEWKSALSMVRIGRFGGEANPFYGKHHTEETKNKIHTANSRYNIYRCEKDSDVVLEVYECAMDAARWVISNNLSTAKVETCNSRILFVCNHSDTCSAYGYKWKLEEKCIE